MDLLIVVLLLILIVVAGIWAVELYTSNDSKPKLKGVVETITNNKRTIDFVKAKEREKFREDFKRRQKEYEDLKKKYDAHLANNPNDDGTPPAS